MLMKKISAVMIAMLTLTLAGCKDATNTKKHDFTFQEIGSYSPTEGETITAFENSEVNVFLSVGETHNLGHVVYPELSSNPTISYSSSDSSVASVDSTGKITAKAPGFAIITGNCNGISSQTYVGVSPVKSEEADKIGKENLLAIKAEQEKEDFAFPNFVRVHEQNYDVTYRNGVKQNERINYEEFVISLDDAYFFIRDTYDSNQKTTGANPTFTQVTWVIYCNNEFQTFLFHEQNGLRRYLKVDCTKYVSTGNPLLGVYDVLDKLFSSGHKLMSSQCDDVGSAEETDDLYGIMTTTSKGDMEVLKPAEMRYASGTEELRGDVFATYNLDFGTEVLDMETAQNLGIPTGVEAKLERNEKYYYHENYRRSFSSDYHFEYDWRGDSYKKESLLSRSYDIQKKKLYYPDIEAEGWTKGDNIDEI